MRGVWIAAAMLTVFGVLADSQPPPPSGSQPTKSQSSDEMVRPPIQLNGDAHIHQKNVAGEQSQDVRQTADWWARSLGVLTLIVAVIQAGIYLRQAGFMKVQSDLMDRQRIIMDSTLQAMQDANTAQGEFTRDEIKRVEAREAYRDLVVKEDQKIARESAAAATRAADTLPNIERAYVFVVVNHARTVPLGSKGTYIYCDIGFNNHGRTPAIITKMVVGNTYGVSPPQNLINCREADIAPGLVVASNGSYPTPWNIHLTQGDYFHISESNSLWYCYGMVEYKDVLGNERKTGFCWQWGKVTDYKFLISPNTSLNHYS